MSWKGTQGMMNSGPMVFHYQIHKIKDGSFDPTSHLQFNGKSGAFEWTSVTSTALVATVPGIVTEGNIGDDFTGAGRGQTWQAVSSEKASEAVYNTFINLPGKDSGKANMQLPRPPNGWLYQPAEQWSGGKLKFTGDVTGDMGFDEYAEFAATLWETVLFDNKASQGLKDALWGRINVNWKDKEGSYIIGKMWAAVEAYCRLSDGNFKLSDKRKKSLLDGGGGVEKGFNIKADPKATVWRHISWRFHFWPAVLGALAKNDNEKVVGYIAQKTKGATFWGQFGGKKADENTVELDAQKMREILIAGEPKDAPMNPMLDNPKGNPSSANNKKMMPITEADIVDYGPLEQCILLSLMGSLQYQSIETRGRQIGNMLNGVKGLWGPNGPHQPHAWPYGGKIIPVNMVGREPETLLNHLYLPHDNAFSSGEKSVFEIIRDLPINLAESIKYDVEIYKYVDADGIAMPVNLKFHNAPWVTQSDRIDRKSDNQTLKVKDLKIEFKGGTPSTSKSDVLVSIEWQATYLQDLLDFMAVDITKKGSNGRLDLIPDRSEDKLTSLQKKALKPFRDKFGEKNAKNLIYLGDPDKNPEYYRFRAIDFLMAPLFKNKGEGYGRVFKSQYHPDYGRLSLKIVPKFVALKWQEADQALQMNGQKAKYVGYMNKLKEYFQDTSLTLDLAPIDHQISKESDKTDVVLKIDYRGYADSLLTSGLFDALVDQHTIEKRMAREDNLEDAVEQNCTMAEVAKIQSELMRDQVEENLNSIRHIYEFLLNCKGNGQKWEDHAPTRMWLLTMPKDTIVKSMEKKGENGRAKITKPHVLAETEGSYVSLLKGWDLDEKRTEPQFKTLGIAQAEEGEDPLKNQQIYFTFLGDIIDAVSSTTYTAPSYEEVPSSYNKGKKESLRKAQKPYFPSFRYRKDGVQGKCVKYLLGSFSYWDKAYPDMKIPRTVNMADIPIAWDLFADFMQKEIIEKEVFRMPVIVFIRRLIKKFVQTLMNEDCYTLGTNNFAFDVLQEKGAPDTTDLSDNWKKNAKIVSTGRDSTLRQWATQCEDAWKEEKNKKEAGAWTKSVKPRVQHSKHNGYQLAEGPWIDVFKEKFEQVTLDSWWGLDLPAANIQPFRKPDNITAAEMFDYVLIYPIYRNMFNPQNNAEYGNMDWNKKNKIQQVVQFDTVEAFSKNQVLKGPVRSIDFKKSQDGHRRESRYFNPQFTNITQMASVYDVTITFICVLPHLYPGQLIHVSSKEMGDPGNTSSVAYQLGFGGYHVITKVTHKFDNWGTESGILGEYPEQPHTIVEAKWVYAGAPSDLRLSEDAGKNKDIQEIKEKWCAEQVLLASSWSSSTDLKTIYSNNAGNSVEKLQQEIEDYRASAADEEVSLQIQSIFAAYRDGDTQMHQVINPRNQDEWQFEPKTWDIPNVTEPETLDGVMVFNPETGKWEAWDMFGFPLTTYRLTGAGELEEIL